MTNLDLFKEANGNCIYLGGAGKGGSYTGLLKLAEHVEQGKKCAVVVRNKKWLHELRANLKEITAKDSKVDFLSIDALHGRLYDVLFVDCCNQLDEDYDLDYFKRRAKTVIINTNSTKCRGSIFNTIKSHLIKHDGYYEFPDNLNGIEVCGFKYFHGTCFDNVRFIKQNPRYVVTLWNLPKDQRNSLLFGHFVENEA